MTANEVALCVVVLVHSGLMGWVLASIHSLSRQVRRLDEDQFLTMKHTNLLSRLLFMALGLEPQKQEEERP